MAPWATLLCAARREVERVRSELPEELRRTAEALPVTYERLPGRALVDDGLDPDLLGLFVGEPVGNESGGLGIPAQVFLFLENLWEFSEESEDVFCQEVRTTYLHELGHYLGLDEEDLEERGLE